MLVIARALTPAEAAVTPLPVSTEGIPNDHLNYAVTWFSLAAVWRFRPFFLEHQRILQGDSPDLIAGFVVGALSVLRRRRTRDETSTEADMVAVTAAHGAVPGAPV